MSSTFVVYVEDKPGVLNRIASLFRRRAFNIESLTVGHTEAPGVSRMTIVIASPRRTDWVRSAGSGVPEPRSSSPSSGANTL